MDGAITEIERNADATSLRSAHPAPESPFKWFKKDAHGYFKPLADTLTADKANDPRQGFGDAYIPDGYVDVLKASFIMKNDLMHGDRMIGFVSPVCTEVDTPHDFELLEYEIKNKGSVLQNYLREHFAPEGK